MIEKHTHYALTLAGVLLMHVVPAICGDGVTHPACLSECLETKDIKVTLVQKRQNYVLTIRRVTQTSALRNR